MNIPSGGLRRFGERKLKICHDCKLVQQHESSTIPLSHMLQGTISIKSEVSKENTLGILKTSPMKWLLSI